MTWHEKSCKFYQDCSAGLEPQGKKYKVHETVFMILLIFLLIGEFRLDVLVIETLHTTSEPSKFLYKRSYMVTRTGPKGFLGLSN